MRAPLLPTTHDKQVLLNRKIKIASLCLAWNTAATSTSGSSAIFASPAAAACLAELPVPRSLRRSAHMKDCGMEGGCVTGRWCQCSMDM